MATASAAERTLSPLEEAVRELCWMTGAGEPVGSELSFGLSGFFPPRKEEEKKYLEHIGRVPEEYNTQDNQSVPSHHIYVSTTTTTHSLKLFLKDAPVAEWILKHTFSCSLGKVTLTNRLGKSTRTVGLNL